MSPTAAPPWVIADLSGSVLWLTLNRPGQRNPLSSQMIKALIQEPFDAEQYDKNYRQHMANTIY